VKALIVGAGIGGLSAAIALRRRGIEAVVFERATELKDIGAGIAIAANAMKALAWLGLADVVRKIGAQPRFYEIRSWRGEVLSRVPMSELGERVGADSIAAHRADLQAALLKALEEAEGEVKLGARYVGFEQNGGNVAVFLADGRQEYGDLLVGADGLRSTVREQLLGDGSPRYAGYTAWRAVVGEEPDLVPEGIGIESWGKGLRFLCARIGRGMVYWAAAKNSPEGEGDRLGGGAKDALLEDFRCWHAPVEALIRATDEDAILYTDIYDREPARRWGEGQVTLLGDAAHPMTPDLGQGACQAIEDAVVLATCLDDEEADVASALRLYEARRIGRTAVFVRRSRRLGWLAQLENPLLCRLRDAFLKITPNQMMLKQTAEFLTYDV
jgi:2-polyprenyl-6-methoxyphenol hydroxylase-like FAD-dependent oxidoreductase